jgi:carboxyl-terminal processing protease
MPRRTLKLLVAVLAALVPAALVLGIWWGGHPASLPGLLRAALVSSDLDTVDGALRIIEDDYYRKLPRGRLVDDSVAGVVAHLHDRFSAYLSPSEYARFEASSRGEFSGVGMEVTVARAGLRVTRVFGGAPAARAGLRAGDLVVAVDGRSLAGRPSAFSSALIRGRPGTLVTLTVQRAGARRALTLRRARIDAPAVTTSLRAERHLKLGVVALSAFTEGAHGELRAAIARLRRRGARGIVLDLRDNGGGLLDEAVLVASVFIPDGTIVSTAGRTRPRHVYRATGAASAPTIPLVVLVDRGTASASEIVAGAIQDRHRGAIVGTRTFGKGVFQEVRALPNGGALDLTVGEYFLPSGRNLGGAGTRPGAGIAPDVRAVDDPRTSRDEALGVALRTLAREVR